MRFGSFTDDVLGTLFAHLEGAVPSSVNGVLKVTAPVKASNDQVAAFRLIGQLEAALPDASIIRVDQDLVSIADIAQRTNRSRESALLLADGKRGPGGFPAPVGTVGDGIRVWPWASVVSWFREILDVDLSEEGVSPETAAFVDACLCGKVRQLPTRPKAAAARKKPVTKKATRAGKQTAKGRVAVYAGAHGSQCTQSRVSGGGLSRRLVRARTRFAGYPLLPR